MKVEFYANDRARAKALADCHDTIAYIAALEAIALAAYDVWKNTPHANKPTDLTRDSLERLYDALQVVNFMDESL